MRGILSFIFDRVTDPLTLPIEPWKEWVILGVIGLFAYKIAYDAVGGMYAVGFIDGRLAGSLAHWTIRALIFASVWFVTYWVIVIGQWIQANPLPALCILGGIVTAGVAAFFLIRWWTGKRGDKDKA